MSNEFKDWFRSEPYRIKYSVDHPAWLAAKEAWDEQDKRIKQLEQERDALMAENERLMDKRAIYDDLIKAFVHYQYRLENPMPSASETEQTRIVKYQSDSIFHAKVDSLAAGVMQIIDKHR